MNRHVAQTAASRALPCQGELGISAFADSTVELTANAWPKSDCLHIAHGADTAGDMPTTERTDCVQVLLAPFLGDTILPKLISSEIRSQTKKRRSSDGPD